MKAVIEVSRKGSIFGAAAKQVAAARLGKVPDFHLSFESARSLFAELTPARLDLLDTLRRVGPCSVYALAKAAERNYWGFTESHPLAAFKWTLLHDLARFTRIPKDWAPGIDQYSTETTWRYCAPSATD